MEGGEVRELREWKNKEAEFFKGSEESDTER